jgi:predicted Zn-dependent protease
VSAPDLEALAQRTVALTTQHPGVEANVQVKRTRHGLARFANSMIHQHVAEDTVHVVLDLAVDGRSATASTTAVEDARIEELVASTVASARLQPIDPHWPGASPPAQVATGHEPDPETAAGDPDARAAGVAAFVAADTGLRAAGYLDTEGTWTAFASTAGQRAFGATTRATIDGIHQTATSAGGAHQTDRRIAALDPAAAGRRAADHARRSASFTDLEPGTFEVVLAPEAVATVLVFLAAYGFNAKAHLDDASFVRLGTQQLDPSISLYEDPFDPRSVTLPFDAEGTPRRRFALVEDGVVAALAHDRRTALRAGTSSTASAVPGGAAFGAMPTSMVLAPGGVPPDELVAGVERGLLVTQLHYCRILDPKTQVVTGLTRNGTFLVEGGRITGAVGNLRFTQSLVEALAPGGVLGVGDDDRYADTEFGPGLVICPSLRLGAWEFTGGARG